MARRLSHTHHVEWLRRLTSDFAAASTSIDHDAGVPSCPGWNVTDLVRHLGRVHAWARAAIVEQRSVEQEFDPLSGENLTRWYSEQAEALIHAIESTSTDDEVWTFAPPPHRVTFWSRRQAHETAIHLWDARAATRLDMSLDPALAADGIDEVLTMFYPRQVRLGRTPPLTRTVEFVCPSGRGAGRWVFGPATSEDSSTGSPEAAVTGSASDLQLLIWKRRRIDAPGLSVSGDAEAVRAVLDHRLTP